MAALILRAATAPSVHAEQPTSGETGPPPVVEVRGGLVTLEARDAALSELLAALAEQAGFKLSMRRGAALTGTWRFSDVPLEAALDRILQSASFLRSYDPDSGQLAELRVLRSGRKARGTSAEGAASEHRPGVTRALSGADDPLRALRDRIRRPVASDAPDLVHVLAGHQDPAFRAMAAVGLGKLQSEEARQALIGALTDGDGLVRRRAVQGLGRLRGGEAVTGLGRVLLEDLDPAVRREAALGLARISTRESQDLLLQAEGDGDPAVRRAVAHALDLH